jgi:putative PIN family toxin of toxin-antitoxin system
VRPGKKAKPPRLVLDTNVFVSAIISGKGAPAEILRAFQKSKVAVLISDEIMDEYLKVLSYPKIRKYPAITDEYVAHVCALLIHEAERIEVRTRLTLSPDPDDNKLLELAVDGEAAMLVTGDKGDLLSLKDVEGIPIVTARKCVEELGLR